MRSTKGTLTNNYFWIMERKQSSRVRRIFTVAFLLFLVTAGGYNSANPVRQSLTFT